MLARGLAPSALILASLMLSCCTQDERSALPGLISTSSRQFSDEDKRIAQSLSIGNVPVVSADADPYTDALDCSIALESISERLSQAGSAQSTYLNVIGQAQGIYSRQASLMAAERDKSPEDIAEDREIRANAVPELRDRGLLAIRCLRKLA